MLTSQEMYQEIEELWYAMTKKKYRHEDMRLYFEQPQKGYGYQGGGEFYLYVKYNAYFLSYSERGTEDIIVESEDFDDIRFEVAWEMTCIIISRMIAKHKRRYKQGMDWQTRMNIQLDLLKNIDERTYNRAKAKWEQIVDSQDT